MDKNTLKPVKRRPKTCMCGCGEKFTPKRSNQTFANAAHRKNYWQTRFDAHASKFYQLCLLNRKFIESVFAHKEHVMRLINRRQKIEQKKPSATTA